MLDKKIIIDKSGTKILETSISGKPLLTIPQLNKGTAFTREERIEFNLMGKLPSRIETLAQQAKRAYLQYASYSKQVNKNIYMTRLLNTNETLFYKLLSMHLEEILPNIYTPMVGTAVQAFSQQFQQPRGLYISYEDRDNIELILKNRSNPEIDIVVVSDGEGVLGIGDQGIGAMAIPVAKLMVYTAFAGINPGRTLPIVLDPGTNNDALLDDPLYLGWHHPRITGSKYDEFIQKFINAIKKQLPQSFLHWEDFGRHNAYRNLIKYREQLCSFNDDIQGTGVVALAAVLSAVEQTKIPLEEQRIVIFGAGTAGIGVAENIYNAFVQAGMDKKTARAKFWLVDRPGLLTELVRNQTTEAQQLYLRSQQEIEGWDVVNKNNINLEETIKHVKPTVLIGTSAMPGAFNENSIKEMAKHVKYPVIFPLSNPPERCECHPQDVLQWTEGRALIATGSPFDNVSYNNKTIPISQCNNYFAFPGIGLGVVAIKAKRVSDNMLMAASNALGHFTQTHDRALLPSIPQARKASRAIAIAVAETALEEGNAQVEVTSSVANLIDSLMWEPAYLPYRRIGG